MTASEFRPGFRLSLVDVVVLVCGTVGAVAGWHGYRDLAVLGVVAVGHFFLFCNVFRVARRPELVWASVFVASVAVQRLAHVSWGVVILVVACTSSAVIANELRKPSYHGILWHRINPGLPDWWASQQR